MVVSWCHGMRSGVYAMVGSASMLAGFKQMAVAVVVFITGLSRLSMKRSGESLNRCAAGAANDLGLIPPLMLAVWPLTWLF